MLTLFDQLWACSLAPNEPVRSSLAGNLSPLLKTRTSPLPSTSRGALQKLTARKCCRKTRKRKWKCRRAVFILAPAYKESTVEEKTMRASEFLQNDAEPTHSAGVADRLVLLLRQPTA
jgi:hypothetical protein